ncbi:MAG: hypothetical protein WCT08_04360 [Patescibacteria group bacterium]|jgi:hypothetical protein
MFFARIEVPKQKFVPGLGFVGDLQSKYPFSFDWNENPPTANIPSGLLLDCVSQDVIIHNFERSFSFPTIKRWARLQISRNATVEINLINHPTCRVYLYEHKIVLVGLRTIADRVQVVPALGEIIEILKDELLMQLLLQRLLSYKPENTSLTNNDAQLLDNVVDGNSTKKNAGALRALAAKIRHEVAQ